jgi:hypothetical protein
LAQVTAGAQIDSVVQELQNRLGFSDARKEMIRDAMVVSASMGVVGKAGKGSAGRAKRGAASSGAENAAFYPKLKDQLIQENLRNIAAKD